jgi:hypothetical protein
MFYGFLVSRVVEVIVVLCGIVVVLVGRKFQLKNMINVLGTGTFDSRN